MRATFSTTSPIDRLFPAALTFCLLAGGTLAIASAWFEGSPAATRSAQSQATPSLVQLPAVETTGRRVGRSPAWARSQSTIAFEISPVADSTTTTTKLGDHPAIVARRVIAAQGYDYASKFYPHPAWLYLSTEAPLSTAGDPAGTTSRHAERDRLTAREGVPAELAKR